MVRGNFPLAALHRERPELESGWAVEGNLVDHRQEDRDRPILFLGGKKRDGPLHPGTDIGGGLARAGG